MLTKIISGGQTGADQGGLYGAKASGIETGGWMPKGWKTWTGPNPTIAKFFHMSEHKSDKYPPRTYQNVKESDGTLRVASDFNSRGEQCTLKAINNCGKNYFDVKYKFNKKMPDSETIDRVAFWVVTDNINILNVAGNREETAPGIQEFTTNLIIGVYKTLRGEI